MDQVLVLSGGVGGAKLVDGLARRLPPAGLTVLGNVGDDVERHGLWVSPDVDIVTYTLAGVLDRAKGWGYADETFHALGALAALGESTWMNLGDRDLATHILRTALRRQGLRPTEIAARIAEHLGVRQRILLPTDEAVQTRVHTDRGELNFQEFFLREQCEPEIRAVSFHGAERARATPEALTALAAADLIVVAPSNPAASIGPILAVPGIRNALCRSPALKLVVSPLVGGRSLKGPSDRMMRALGYRADAVGVADIYADFLQAFVVDEQDGALQDELAARGLDLLVTNTIMARDEDRVRLAGELLDFARTMRHART